MKPEELDEKLKQYSQKEKELLDLYKSSESRFGDEKLKEYFSSRQKNDNWVINSEKLMKASEVISIRKHDRFMRFDKHRHDFLEMTFVYSGSIHQQIEGKELEIKKGEIILLDMNVEHSIEAAKGKDIAINILIKKEFFDWMFLSQIAYNDLISDFIVKALYGKENIKQYIHFKTSENDRVWDYMLQILMEYYEQRNGMETAIRAYMLLLFNELLRDYERYLSSQITCNIDTTISLEILNYIKNNFRDMNLKKMSEYFSYNSDYIGKLVKKVTGKNLKVLIIEQRMAQAKYLLKNTDLPVTDIITEVGCTNISYFYKQFKDRFEVTPDEFRKRE